MVPPLPLGTLPVESGEFIPLISGDSGEPVGDLHDNSGFRIAGILLAILLAVGSTGHQGEDNSGRYTVVTWLLSVLQSNRVRIGPRAKRATRCGDGQRETQASDVEDDDGDSLATCDDAQPHGASVALRGCLRGSAQPCPKRSLRGQLSGTLRPVT